MTEGHPLGRHRVSAQDRQTLAAAYLPVIAFGAVLIAARIPHRLRAALR